MIKADQPRDGNMQDAPLLWERLRRFVPVAVVSLAMAAVFCSGLYRQISLETLVQLRLAIDALVAAHGVAAVAGFVAIYIDAVAVAIPGASLRTLSSGRLGGVAVG